jgi:hypothetical protein
LPCSAAINRTTGPSCARRIWPSMRLLLVLERPEKERGFSAPLLERKDFDIKRESIMIIFGSFLPSLLVGLRHQSLLGPGSRHCYGIISLTTPANRSCTDTFVVTHHVPTGSVTIPVMAK